MRLMFYGDIMKKLIGRLPLYIIMVYCFIALSGCGGKSYTGKNIVDRAKSLHTGLESAHITVSDCSDSDNEIIVQEIWYRFAGDVMQYMYIGRDAATGEEYYEFNNGTELDTWHSGDADWSFAAKGSEGFYNYSRASRHYFADGDKLLEDHSSAVSEAAVTDGEKHISIEYYADMGQYYSSMEGITDYSARYDFDSDGYCAVHTMTYIKDGSSYKYKVEIGRTDADKSIERREPSALSDGQQQ